MQGRHSPKNDLCYQSTCAIKIAVLYDVIKLLQNNLGKQKLIHTKFTGIRLHYHSV